MEGKVKSILIKLPDILEEEDNLDISIEKSHLESGSLASINQSSDQLIGFSMKELDSMNQQFKRRAERVKTINRVTPIRIQRLSNSTSHTRNSIPFSATPLELSPRVLNLKVKQKQRKCRCKLWSPPIYMQYILKIIYTSLVLFSVFGDNLRKLFISPHFDLFIDALLIITFLVLAAEMLADAAKNKFTCFCELIFWLEIFGTISILMDVTLLDSYYDSVK